MHPSTPKREESSQLIHTRAPAEQMCCTPQRKQTHNIQGTSAERGLGAKLSEEYVHISKMQLPERSERRPPRGGGNELRSGLACCFHKEPRASRGTGRRWTRSGSVDSFIHAAPLEPGDGFISHICMALWIIRGNNNNNTQECRRGGQRTHGHWFQVLRRRGAFKQWDYRDAMTLVVAMQISFRVDAFLKGKTQFNPNSNPLLLLSWAERQP